MDIALDRSMIPLGSCTMKLNATTEMAAVTWPEFGQLHPFCPPEQAEGYRELITSLEAWLAEITGYDRVSLQPNAGSQGELAGLLAIRGYHASRGEPARDVCLIPSSAHGTNAASAVMAGMRVVVVACDDDGNVDVDDLRAKVEEHSTDLSRADGHLPVHPRRVRGADHRHLRPRARARRPGVRRRRQPQRAGRHRPPGLVRRRRQPPEPAQDVLHPPRRRRPGRRAGGGARAPRPVPAEPPARSRGRPGHRARADLRRRRTGRRRSCRSRGPTSRSMGPDGLTPRHRAGDPQRQLRGRPPRRRLPGALHGRPRPRRPRVHPRPAADHPGHRRHRRRRRQAAHRLRVPRARR